MRREASVAALLDGVSLRGVWMAVSVKPPLVYRWLLNPLRRLCCDGLAPELSRSQAWQAFFHQTSKKVVSINLSVRRGQRRKVA